MMAHFSVLIVDDDIKLTSLLKTYFEKDGFLTFLAHNGQQALNLAYSKEPNIIILDLMLPDLDGWEVCRRIRKDSEVPIIMLTARDEEMDRLNGLEIGADDYVTKPFSPREVVARAKVILRRVRKASLKLSIIKFGTIKLDVKSHQVTNNGRVLDITPTEFKILELLACNQNRVFSRLQIVEQIQGYAFEGYERTIDAHIKNIRRKIEKNSKDPRYIQTVYGVGYKLIGDINEYE